jgi:hypothetical protein
MFMRCFPITSWLEVAVDDRLNNLQTVQLARGQALKASIEGLILRSRLSQRNMCSITSRLSIVTRIGAEKLALFLDRLKGRRQIGANRIDA